MNRRSLFVVVVILVFMGASAFYIIHPSDKINATNLERIQKGMTEYEVVELLGNPNTCPYEFGIHQGTTWLSDNGNLIYVVWQKQKENLVVRQTAGHFPSFWQRIEQRWERYSNRS